MANTTDSSGGGTAGSESESSKRLSRRVTDAIRRRVGRGDDEDGDDGESQQDADDADSGETQSSGGGDADTSRFDRVRQAVSKRREQASSAASSAKDAGARVQRKAEQLQQRTSEFDDEQATSSSGGLSERERQQATAAVAEDVASVRQEQQGVEQQGGRVGQQATEFEQSVTSTGGQLDQAAAQLEATVDGEISSFDIQGTGTPGVFTAEATLESGETVERRVRTLTDPDDVRVQRDGDTLRLEATQTGRDVFAEFDERRRARQRERREDAVNAVFGAAEAVVNDPGREMDTDQDVTVVEQSITGDPSPFSGPTDSAAPRTRSNFVDEQIEDFERSQGIDAIPGEGDVVQSLESRLSEAARNQREGRGWIPSATQVRTQIRESQADALTSRGIPDSVAEGTVRGDSGPLVGAGGAIAEQANPAGIVLSTGRLAEAAGEFTFNVAGGALPTTSDVRIDEDVLGDTGAFDEFVTTRREKADEQAEAAADTVVALGDETAESFRERPFETVGSAIGLVALGGAEIGASRAAGRAGRFIRDRKRTVGGTKLDAEELVGEDVLRNVDTDGAEGEAFPGADDPDLYQADPPAAVTEQADRFTPPAVEEFFRQEGFGGGTTLKKTLDVEPEGPGSGRSSQGFTSAPDEAPTADDPTPAFDYENPGSFFGPELSPNFLRVGGERSISLRPGLPDFGGEPTGVLARLDVEAPEATTQSEFVDELRARSGEGTALTKPSGSAALTPDEIEAVVPPGTEFTDVGSGVGRNVARRLGVGSDFYTEIGGRRVPLRAVVPDDASAGRAADDVADAGDATLSLDFDGASQTLDDIVRGPSRSVDRPFGGSVAPTSFGEDTDRGASRTTPSDVSTPRIPPSEPPSPPSDSRSPPESRDGPESSPPFSIPSDIGGPSAPPSSPPSEPGEPTPPPSSPPFTPSSPPSGPPSDPSNPPSGPPGIPSIPTSGQPGNRPRVPNFDADTNEQDDERREFRVDDEVFDTGVVQSLSELEEAETNVDLSEL